MLFHQATQRLRRRLGSRVVATDEAACFAASFDSSKISFLPEAVITPRREAEVGTVLELANEFRVPVTVRGRGTTLTGAAAPVLNGWVIDLRRLNRITVDRVAGMAEVQCGATTADIQRAAEAKGWFYPPDPSSKEYCTIGGNIACNAGGMHGGKYGVTRDFVVALRGFLPTGEYVEWGTATKKFSAGFNLRDLWIGSEGMLGVVTGAVLKLIPQPAARWTLLTVVPRRNGRAARRTHACFGRGCSRPSVSFSIARVCFVRNARRGKSFCRAVGPAGAVCSNWPARARRKCANSGGRARVGEATRERASRARAHERKPESLWAVRRKCSGAMFELGDSKLNEDIVVPMRNYVRVRRFLAKR